MIAVYPGTFDPVTRGHADIASRAIGLFDKVIIAVEVAAGETLFTLDERIALCSTVFSAHDNIEIKPLDTLVTDFACRHKAKILIRGIRAFSDFDYELQMAGMNRQLFQEIETVFLLPAENLGFIAASLVREIASYDGDVTPFVHEPVAKALKEKFS